MWHSEVVSPLGCLSGGTWFRFPPRPSFFYFLFGDFINSGEQFNFNSIIYLFQSIKKHVKGIEMRQRLTSLIRLGSMDNTVINCLVWAEGCYSTILIIFKSGFQDDGNKSKNRTWNFRKKDLVLPCIIAGPYWFWDMVCILLMLFGERKNFIRLPSFFGMEIIFPQKKWKLMLIKPKL